MFGTMKVRRALGAGILAAALASPAAAVVHSGQAYGARIDVPLLAPIVLADTGPLPAAGGSLSNFLLNANATLGSQTVTSTTMNTSTQGAAGTSQSTALTEGLDVGLHCGLLGAAVTADVLRADAAATCGSATGSSLILNLRINNLPVTVTGQPNQTVGIPGIATLTLNEQIVTGSGITVNALHVAVLGH